MPATPAWMLQIPEILDQLTALDTPVIDRAVCERLFGVKRRRAIQLMQTFGGFRSGNTILVDRSHLIRGLQGLLNGDTYVREHRRKHKLADSLNDLHRHRAAARIILPVSPDVHNRTVDSLPAGISLERGRLRIDFASVEELFAKLYELAQAAANDYDTIAEVIAKRSDHNEHSQPVTNYNSL